MAFPKTNKGARKNPLFGQFPISKRVPSSQTTYCRLVVFHYVKQNFTTSTNLRDTFIDDVVYETKRFVIDEGNIAAARIGKSLAKFSGSFDISLFSYSKLESSNLSG